MAERPCEAGHMVRRGEGDDGDPTPGGLNLFRMHAQLGEVLLAEEATEMAEQDQDGGAAEQAPRGVLVAGNVSQIEVELYPRHPGVG